MNPGQWLAIAALAVIVAMLGFCIWSIFHHETLDDRDVEDWFNELVADTHLVEQDRIAKRARGECSCTLPAHGSDNSLIADRRCPIHGGHHHA